MYSTPKKRLFELKKELKQLKRKMDKRVIIAESRKEIPKSFGLTYDYGNWSCYSIITSDGTYYAIDCTSRYFPCIDFNKIVYVNKKLLCNDTYSNYDSTTGYYQIKNNYEYPKYINNKFRVKIFVNCTSED